LRYLLCRFSIFGTEGRPGDGSRHPISILAIGLARVYKRRTSLLENVIITGIGAASGSVVAGAIFTLPRSTSFTSDPHPVQTIFICLAGGCMGVLS